MSAAVDQRVYEAIGFAARAHRHQIRKDGSTPYVAHVFRVMTIVRHEFNCVDHGAMMAAVLHDTIEDTTTDHDDLAERFGVQVADLVAALTKNMAMPEPEREHEYDARLAKADWRARLVKLADVLDNARDCASGAGMKREMALSKCARAIELARGDSGRAEVRAAIQAVEAEMRS